MRAFPTFVRKKGLYLIVYCTSLIKMMIVIVSKNNSLLYFLFYP